MSNACYSSMHALAQAILEELGKVDNNSLHSTIRISYDVKQLPNGIKRCSVQIECRMGCGWLIEASEGEAEALLQKAIDIQRMLEGSVKEDLKSLPEILLAVFPEFVTERQAVFPIGANTSRLGES